MENERELIYLAALLHDIGKFYQRADSGGTVKSKFLHVPCKDEALFCPEKNGEYTHEHVLWTAQFIYDNMAVFKNLLGNGLSDLSDKNNLIHVAACHHLPVGLLSENGKIVKEADSLSYGQNRESDGAMGDAADEKNWDVFKGKRLASIMQMIKQPAVNISWYMPVNHMSLAEHSFPRKKFEKEPDYAGLWNAFEREFKFIQANTYHAFSETLLNLLFKYTVSIPSSTVNFPDISLYDHLKTTAALAVCLYDVKKAGGNHENPFLLIGADFSGIQSYLYQIVSKYAGKNLKGRSFYLRLLSDTIVRFLLKELNLFQANIVYNSGGSFYLLAPNTSWIEDKLSAANRKIEEYLFKYHGISLFVAIDSIPFSKDVLMCENGESLGRLWGDLFVKRDMKKSCKFVSQIERNYDDFFSPVMSGGNAKRDVITGEEFAKDEVPVEENGLLLRQITKDQIDLGKVLRESEVMAIADRILEYWENKVSVEPAGLGFHYYFLKQKDLDDKKEQLRLLADKVSVITLNGKNGNCDFMRSVEGINNIYGLEFYGGNEFNGNTFEEMCENPGFSRLGVLRMDVDNLGSIFQSGIEPQSATLSRYAALSRSLDYFFSGFLNTIWRETEPDKSFIIYSGGDDVFIVGSWDVTIKLAKRIHSDFKVFACQNPAFSVSGGIAVVPAKFPVMKGADESEHEEKNAKGHPCKGAEKNAVSFMNTALHWEKEFPAVESLKDVIVHLISSETLPKSFISKILMHVANAGFKNHKITEIKTYWLMTYDLSRMRGRVKDAEAKKLIDNCKAELYGDKNTLDGLLLETNYHALELWAFACRWAELELRAEK